MIIKKILPALFICLLIFFFIRYTIHHKELLQKRKEEDLTRIIQLATPQLIKRWEKGDLEGDLAKKKIHCPEEIDTNFPSHLDEFYLRCNPNYWQCYFSGGTSVKDTAIPIHYQGSLFHLEVRPNFSPLSFYSSSIRFYQITYRQNERFHLPLYGMLINVGLREYPELSMDLLLEDSCTDTYLPQRVYASGASTLLRPPASDKDEWRWDNFHRHITIDKNLVTNRQVIEWALTKNITLKYPLPKERRLWSLPATTLIAKEMQAYCASRGASILPAHIYDAATFYPPDKSDLHPTYISRGPYPWTTSLAWPTEKNCQKIYSAECVAETPYTHFSNLNPSWMGLNESLGGYLEYLPNPLHPKENLKASSFYFPANSPWHQLGLRAHWDGEDFFPRNFTWEIARGKFTGKIPEPEINTSRLEVAFRCVREVL